jgi:hypothetical protein
MKQRKLFIFLLFLFSLSQTKESKVTSIVLCLKKTKTAHRFILPIIAASELTVSLCTTLIPILIASFGNINFCLPAAPEIFLEKDVNTLQLH